jgi:exodeoxyribonuclease VII small subunit
MKDKDKDLNFEKALADLETVVEKLEKGGLSLNESLGLFEKGVTLARYLRGELDKAEKRIEILLKDEKGGVKAGPFSLEDVEGKGGTADGGSSDEADVEGGDDDDDAGEGAAKKKTKSRPKKSDDGSELPF